MLITNSAGNLQNISSDLWSTGFIVTFKMVHAYTWISASKRLAVWGPESSLIPPTPVSETTGEELGVLRVREDRDGVKVGVIADGVSPVFLANGE